MTFVDVDRPPLVPRLEKFEAAQRVMSMQEQQQLKKLSSAQQQQEDQLQSKTVAATTHSLENSTSASAQDSENMTASNTVAMGQSQQQTPAVVKAPTLSRTKRPVMRPSQVDKKHQQMRLQHRMLQQQHRDSLDRASLFFMRDSARLSAVANNHYNNNNNINNVVKNNLYSSRHPAVEEDSCVLDACPSLPSTPQATSPRSPHEYQEQQCQEQNNSAKYNSSASNYDDLASAQKLIQGLRLDNKMPASSAATIMANGMPTAATNNSDTFTPAGHKRPRSLNSSFAPGSIAAANADVFVDNNNMNNNSGRGLTSSPDFAPLSVSSTTLDPDAKTTVAYDGVRAKATTPAANASGIAGTTRKRARLVRRDARSAPCSWNAAEQQATVRFLQCLQTKFRHMPKTDIDSPTSVSSGEDSSSSSTRSHASDASDDYHQVARLQHSYAQHIEN
mmetsp:Transcript_5344/g.11020  ORF Transcript_5344/g.11020 Transcript_5344/m.11020 type:complete len:447 (-) Transcript_5344:610-1950(-)